MRKVIVWLSRNRYILIIIFINIILLLCYAPDTQAQNPKKTAKIQLQFSKENSKKIITAKLNEFTNDSIGESINGMDVYFYVKRTFSLLPIGDDFHFTDEKGETKVEFPDDLPGDSVGNVEVIVKIENNEIYEDTEIHEIVNWGSPSIYDYEKYKRSLWEAGANAPWSLLILVNLLLAVAWGFIIYILFQFLKIRKYK